MVSVHRRLGRAGHRCERFWERRLPCPFSERREGATGKDRERKDEPPFASEPKLLKAMEVALAGNVEKAEPQRQKNEETVPAVGVRAEEVDESSQGVVESDATRAGGLTLPQDLETAFRGTDEQLLRDGLQQKPTEAVSKAQPVGNIAVSKNLAEATEQQLAQELAQPVERQMRSATSLQSAVEPANEEEALSRQGLGSNSAVVAALAAAAAITTTVHAAQRQGRGRGLKDVSRPANVSQLDRGRGTARPTGGQRAAGGGGFQINTSQLGIRPRFIRKNVQSGGLGFDVESQQWQFQNGFFLPQ